MRIVKPKLVETRPHCFEKAVYDREIAKGISGIKDYYTGGGTEIEEFDTVSYRQRLARPEVQGKDITTVPIEETNRLVKVGDHYIPICIYKREDIQKVVPVLIYIHGGGFAGGDIPFKANNCRYFAEQSGAVVVNVQYRLAPETLFPGPVEDCMGVLDWVYENAAMLGVNKEKIAISGDSAGGTLAANVILKDKERRIKLALLIYGAYDLNDADHSFCKWDYSKYEIDEDHKEVIFNRLYDFRASSDVMGKVYVGGQYDLNDPDVSPIYAEDFSVFPKTVLIEAEFDYFRWDNVELAKKLEAAGVEVDELFYEGLDHGFFDRLGSLTQTADSIEVMSDYIKKM